MERRENEAAGDYDSMNTVRPPDVELIIVGNRFVSVSNVSIVGNRFGRVSVLEDDTNRLSPTSDLDDLEDNMNSLSPTSDDNFLNSLSIPENERDFTSSTISLVDGSNDKYGKRLDENESVPDAFTHNPYHFELYRKALLEGFETDNAIRVNVVGNFAQGKTSLTNSLVRKSNKDVQSTNGVEINHCQYFDANDDVIFESTLPFDDINLLDRLAIVAQNKENPSDKGISQVEQSFKEMELSPKEKTNALEPTTNIEGVSQEQETHAMKGIPSKKDEKNKKYAEPELLAQENRCLLSKTDGQIFSERLQCHTSRINHLAEKLEIWDFAGQFVFYATHILFHSKRAVYLLVFDLSKPLSTVVEDTEDPLSNNVKSMEQYIKFWMNSIHSFVGSDDGTEPKVILVGTHKDKLQGNDAEKAHLAEEYFEKIRSIFENTSILNHIHEEDFAVNNLVSEDNEIIRLRREIISIGKKHNNVPARWIQLEREMMRKRHMKIISFDEVMTTDSKIDFPLKEKEQVKLFLLYHHTKGTIFFFDEQPLSEFVVLDTQFLIDAFKCIVTSKRFCRKKRKYRNLWNLLSEKARLKLDLIDIVWGLDTHNEFMKHKKEILLFMERHLLISRVSLYDEDTEASNEPGWYVVPSFLRDHIDNEAVLEFCKGRKQSALRFVMSFNDSPVVQIIYHRLVAALISKWSVIQIGMSNQKKESLLYRNLGVFRLDRLNAGAVELQQNKIDLRVISLSTSHSDICEPGDTLRRFAEAVVIDEFEKMRQSSTMEGKPFETYFRCNDKSHGLNGSQEVLSLNSLDGKDIELCPDMQGGHDISPQPALSEWFQETSNIELTKDCQFDEKQLGKISRAIGQNWQSLGSELGLHYVQLEQIKLDNEPTYMRIYGMLKTWEREKDEEATVNTLIRAMKTTKDVSVRWDVVRNIVDEIATTQ